MGASGGQVVSKFIPGFGGEVWGTANSPEIVQYLPEKFWKFIDLS